VGASPANGSQGMYGDRRYFTPYIWYMAARKNARMEFRVSEEDRCYLEGRLRERGETLSGWARDMIEKEREAEALTRRLAAVERLAAMNEEWVPADPDELKRMIVEAKADALRDLIDIA
jgi:hypothetical protein